MGSWVAHVNRSDSILSDPWIVNISSFKINSGTVIVQLLVWKEETEQFFDCSITPLFQGGEVVSWSNGKEELPSFWKNYVLVKKKTEKNQNRIFDPTLSWYGANFAGGNSNNDLTKRYTNCYSSSNFPYRTIHAKLVQTKIS